MNDLLHYGIPTADLITYASRTQTGMEMLPMALQGVLTGEGVTPEQPLRSHWSRQSARRKVCRIKKPKRTHLGVLAEITAHRMALIRQRDEMVDLMIEDLPEEEREAARAEVRLWREQEGGIL